MHDEALDILKKMYKFNTRNSEDEFPVKHLMLNEDATGIDKKKEGFFKSMWKQTSPFFKSPFAIKTFLVCLLQFGAFAS